MAFKVGYSNGIDSQPLVAQVVSSFIENSDSGAIILVTSTSDWEVNEDLATVLAMNQFKPFVHYEASSIMSSKQSADRDSIKYDLIATVDHDFSEFVTVYGALQKNFFLGNVILITINDLSSEAHALLANQNKDNIFLVVVSASHVQVVTMKADAMFYATIITNMSNISSAVAKIRSKPNHLGKRHLVISTLNDYPPAIFWNNNSNADYSVYGIEPSVVEVLSRALNFSYDYLVVPPLEMWGDVYPNGSANGLMGALYFRKADFSIGELYLDYDRYLNIDFSFAYMMGYECFLVPASRPYPKWTALYHPLTWQVWIGTFISFGFAVTILKFVAGFSSKIWKRDVFYNDAFVCFLFVFGTMVGVQQPQEIRSPANRLFLIWWFVAATIIPTVYRSGLTSYMTFPFTPPPVDTNEDLVKSSLGKISYGEFVKARLMQSNIALQRALGEQITVSRDLPYMTSLMPTGKWALGSSQDYLRYVAATRYPITSMGPTVHLMKECSLPVFAAFGLQKASPLEPYLDRKLQLLVEAGIIDHERSKFAKKQQEWNPKATNQLVPFSLDSQQGTFYLLMAGVLTSVFMFILEKVNEPRNSQQ